MALTRRRFLLLSRFPPGHQAATLAAIVTAPFRILSLLLCLLVAGPMSTPAWALARPETRVGEIFSSPLKSTPADLDQTLEPRGESRGCDYDFASSVCKYLYAHGDPINLADPSGYDANFTLVGQTTTQGMDLNSRAMGVGTVATFAHSVRASLLFRLGAYAVLGTTVAGNVAIVADALQKAKSEPLNYRPVTSVDEEEDLEGDLTVHRMGGKSNMNLKPAEKNLSPPGFSVLVGGTPYSAPQKLDR